MHGHTDTDTRSRTLMEKTDSYGKDGQLWKRRTLMEKTDTYGKDGKELLSIQLLSRLLLLL